MNDNFFHVFRKTISFGLISYMFFHNSTGIKSEIKSKDMYFFKNKEDITNFASKNINQIEKDFRSIESIVSYLSFFDNHIFFDNDFYRSLRITSAISKIKEYSINTDVVVIDKTFQKALFFKKKDNGYNFINEYDCSTAAIYGKKQRVGDGKTPEGIFEIYSIEEAHDKLWKGKRVYGGYFLRILGSIGIHGNGTDTIKVKNWKNSTFKKPEPLGLYNENFSVGLSHGCIRLNNDVIRFLVENNELKLKDKVIIYENKSLTNILKKYY